ncbi:MAG: hypothetical protein K2X66_15320, partial [Cyanobacteria bacterium]|nr:hypothetical protein [Cyanobacteriota bacterium]
MYQSWKSLRCAALPNMTIELNAKFLETLSTPVVIVDEMGKKICGNTAGEKLLDTLFFNIDKIQTSPKNTTLPQESSHQVNLPELMQSICPVYLDQGDYLLKITALSSHQSILEWISRSETKRLELLQDVSRAVNSSLIMEDIFESLGEVLRHYIQYDEASIVILDESQNTIKTLVRMQPDGFVDINPESHAFAGYDSIVNLLVTNPIPQTIIPAQLYDSLVFSKEVLGENAHGLLIPLINKGVVIGLIALLHTN